MKLVLSFFLRRVVNVNEVVWVAFVNSRTSITSILNILGLFFCFRVGSELANAILFGIPSVCMVGDVNQPHDSTVVVPPISKALVMNFLSPLRRFDTRAFGGANINRRLPFFRVKDLVYLLVEVKLTNKIDVDPVERLVCSARALSAVERGEVLSSLIRCRPKLSYLCFVIFYCFF